MQHDKLIQKIESYINIILFVLEEKEYREYIKSNPLLKKYDSLTYEVKRDHIYIHLNDENLNEVSSVLQNVSGLSSFSYVYRIDNNLEKFIPIR